MSEWDSACAAHPRSLTLQDRPSADCIVAPETVLVWAVSERWILDDGPRRYVNEWPEWKNSPRALASLGGHLDFFYVR